MDNKLIENRETSGFPLSIGTGLALETLFTPIAPVVDDTRVVKNLPDLSIYTIYIFNVSTILRNILSSFKFPEIVGVKNSVFLDVLKEEVDFLNGFFTDNNVPIGFYVNNYTYFKNTYPDKLRKSTTDKQLRLDDITNYCLTEISKEPHVKTFNKDVSFGKEHTALIMTHVPADLLSYGKYAKLDLLESHTGLIKTRKDWNTKYYPIPNKDMSFLPFMEYLLVTFGDKTMFSPGPVKEREDLYNVMLKKGVNALTSEFILLKTLF